MDPLEFHKKHKGKISVCSRIESFGKKELSLSYTPGVAEVVREINNNPSLSFETTIRGRSVAILSNSTRVLGLGEVKPEAGLAVMEGKALLLKEFADVDAFPLSINAKTKEELEFFAKAISPTFGAINLEDIESPLVFELYDELSSSLKIPVFHDDRHGTGIAVLAGVINSLKLLEISSPKIVVVGFGSAGLGILELLNKYGFREIYSLDSKGSLCEDREGVKGTYKERVKNLTKNICLDREDIFRGANVVIAASSPGSIDEKDLSLISKDSALFTLSNPTPEVPYEIAKKYAKIVATGRSDLPNQINNLLAFPSILKAALYLKRIDYDLMLKAALSISSFQKPSFDSIVPSALNKEMHKHVFNSLIYNKT